MNVDYTKRFACSLINFYKAAAKLFYLVIEQFGTAMTGSRTEKLI